jgi:hypothetical protein
MILEPADKGRRRFEAQRDVGAPLLLSEME